MTVTVTIPERAALVSLANKYADFNGTGTVYGLTPSGEIVETYSPPYGGEDRVSRVALADVLRSLADLADLDGGRA